MVQTPQITIKSWLMILLLAFVWGGTFLVTEVALTGITPFWLAAARVGFASLATGAVWLMQGRNLFHSPPPASTYVPLILIGALSGAIPFTLLAWGQQHVTSGFAGVSMASTALILLPLGHVFVPGEQITLRRFIGFVIGFAGVVVLIGLQAFSSTGEALETAGRLACVAAASCYAVSSILMRRLPPVDPIGLSAVVLIVGACISIPAAFLVEGPPPLPAPDILVVLILLGLVPTALANFMRVLVIRSAGPVFMSLVNYQVPVWSVLLGAVILDEPLPPTLIVAMALILTGLAVSQFGALKRLFTGEPGRQGPVDP